MDDEKIVLMCLTRETGVIPGALAGLLVGLRAPEAKVIASVTFMAILVTLLSRRLPRAGWPKLPYSRNDETLPWLR